MHRDARRRPCGRAPQGGGQAGFTLIELLVVVAIIGILAAVLIPNFLRARAQSQVVASKGNLRNLAAALETYYLDHGRYPARLDELASDQVYLRAVPADPCTGRPYTYTPVGDPPADYRLSAAWPAGTPCGRIQPGISYTPAGGLQDSP
jgi:general secretion pathway protein G